MKVFLLFNELFVPFFVFRFGLQKFRNTKILRNSLFIYLLFFILVLPVLPCKRKTSYRKSSYLFLFLVTSSTTTKTKNGMKSSENHNIPSKIISPNCAVQCGHEHQRGRKLHAFQPSPKEVNRMHIITQLSNADNVTH